MPSDLPLGGDDQVGSRLVQAGEVDALGHVKAEVEVQVIGVGIGAGERAVRVELAEMGAQRATGGGILIQGYGSGLRSHCSDSWRQ